MEQQADVTGESHRFTNPLGTGRHFWRLRARRAGQLSGSYGPTWVFTVPDEDRAADSSWPLLEDGLGTCAVGASTAELVHPVFVGDLDGDGTGDYDCAAPSQRFLIVGDYNGDGRSDFISFLPDEAGSRLRGHTSSVGFPDSLTDLDAGYGVLLALGDVNGDAMMDFLIVERCGGAFPTTPPVQLFMGNRATRFVSIPLPECPGAPASWLSTCPTASDVNNDGLTDIVVGPVVYFGGPAGISAEHCEVRP